MKTYFEVGFPSWGVGRVAFQMAKYLPKEIEQAGDPGSAKFTVLHVIGRRDHMLNTAKKIIAEGNQYAVIQYALQSTRNPNPKEWLELWNHAKVVWSYYDLQKYTSHNFYHAPLAADPNVFYPMNIDKKYIIGANGDDYARECVGEVRLAAWETQKRVAHVGNKLTDDPNVDYFKNITDDELRKVYNSCQWWASFRRKDGFEMPAVEAMMCGVRPIVFDTPNYKQWFNGLAEFVPEVDSEKLSVILKHMLKSEPKPLSPEEVIEVKNRFSWGKIIKGFWERCMI